MTIYKYVRVDDNAFGVDISEASFRSTIDAYNGALEEAKAEQRRVEKEVTCLSEYPREQRCLLVTPDTRVVWEVVPVLLTDDDIALAYEEHSRASMRNSIESFAKCDGIELTNEELDEICDEVLDGIAEDDVIVDTRIEIIAKAIKRAKEKDEDVMVKVLVSEAVDSINKDLDAAEQIEDTGYLHRHLYAAVKQYLEDDEITEIDAVDKKMVEETVMDALHAYWYGD